MVHFANHFASSKVVAEDPKSKNFANRKLKRRKSILFTNAYTEDKLQTYHSRKFWIPSTNLHSNLLRINFKHIKKKKGNLVDTQIYTPYLIMAIVLTFWSEFNYKIDSFFAIPQAKQASTTIFIYFGL